MNDDLLVKYLAGEADGEERAAVQSWIDLHPGNESYFRQLKTIWEKSEVLALNSDTDENAAWERFRNKVIVKNGAKTIRPLSFWIRMAAIIVLAGTAGIIALSVYLRSGTVSLVHVQSRQQTLSDTLPDGSVVTMNRNSEISYPSRFTGAKRDVTLNGEAFFNVTADKAHPFTIRVNNNVTVTVIGTSFNIKSRSGKTEVIVETGVVQVAKHNDRVELKAGEKVVAGEKGTLAKGRNTSTLYHSYSDRVFICRDTPLPEFIEAVNDAYNADIVIMNDDLRSLRIHNIFKNDSLETILSVIGETFNNKIKIEREGHKIILR